jgi:hypothetical protein
MDSRIFGTPDLATPRSNTTLSVPGSVQGAVLYFDGAAWVPLAPGAAGNVLTTQGAGANPIWSPPINLPGAAQGSVLYFNGVIWTFLGPGAAGEFLQTQGAGANPTWAAGGQLPATEVVPKPEMPVDQWHLTDDFTIQTTFGGATFYVNQPMSFNRMAFGEQAISAAGVDVDWVIYQAADGLVVDPFPRIATMPWTSTGAASTQVVTPNEGTVSLETGTFVLMAAGDAATAIVEAYAILASPPVNDTIPAGLYPAAFTTAVGGPPAAPPATLAFATMVPSIATTTIVAMRLYTV